MKIQVSMPTTGLNMRYKSHLTMVLGVALLALTSANDVSAQSAFGGKVSQTGQFVNNGQSYTVMQASQVPTAADRPGSIGAAINGQNSVQQVGCQSCGTSCGGACGGYSAYGDTAFGDTFDGYQSIGGACNNGCNNACGIPCDPYCYVRAEGLYMQREDSNRGLSRNVGLSDYDYEWASRITVGSLPNCVNGYEMTYVSPLKWNAAGAATDVGGSLGTVFGPPTTPARQQFLLQLPAFENMTAQNQSVEAEYWSIEGNKTLVGWDVAKVLLGGRYIQYDEQMLFSGVNTGGLSAVAGSQTENRMIGAQLGLDLLYPVGLFAYTDFRARAGVYYNNAEASFQAINNGALVVNTRDTEGGIAGVFELGSGIRYQLGEMLSVRAGTEMWYISRVAEAADQVGSLSFSALDLVYQSRINNNSDFFVFGFNIGAELKY